MPARVVFDSLGRASFEYPEYEENRPQHRNTSIVVTAYTAVARLASQAHELC